MPNPARWLKHAESDSFDKGSVVFGVEDIAETKKHLDEQGLQTGDIQDYGLVKILEIKDPDGNSISFAQEM